MHAVRNVYFNMTTEQLRRLKSSKSVRLTKLEHDMGYFAMKEKPRLRQQIRWIDAVLESRKHQQGLDFS